MLLAALISVAGVFAPVRATSTVSRAAQEAAFLKTIEADKTAYVVTGDLVHFAGVHVNYVCDVEGIVRPGVAIGQCGYESEPTDLFLNMPTEHVKVGDRYRILGIIERPESWTDLLGHTVYYAFVRAVFVDPVKKDSR